MGEAFITRRGGSSAKVYAVIGVTYPTGSTCTCTDGAKTLTAKDTTGRALFVIPSAGTWTVTATDGTNTKSESVEITSEGQSKNVELMYEFVLYENGNKYESVTGGWAYSRYVTFNTNKISINGGAGYPSGVSTTNSIPLSKYSTLKMLCTINSTRGNTSDVLCFGVTNAKITDGDPTFNAKTERPFEVSTNKIITCDISSVNSGYVCVYAKYVFDMDVFKIWLE